MIETNNVVERLKKRKRVLYDDETLRYAFELINPDGPEAADLIQSLSARVDVLEGLLRRVEPHLDAIICYASTMGEHEPNRIAFDVRAALARTQGGKNVG